MRERKKSPGKLIQMWTQSLSLCCSIWLDLIVAAMGEILVFVTAMVGCKGFVAVCGGF